MPQTPTKFVDWPAIALVVGCGIVAALNVGKIAPSLPSLIEELQLSLPIAGWLVGGISTTAMLLGLLMGRVVDRFGAQRMLMLGLLFCALGSMAGAFAHDWRFLLVTRFLEGLGLVWVIVSAPTLLVLKTPVSQRARVMGWWSCFMPLGTGLSILLAPLMLEYSGWRGVWIAVCVLSFIMLGLAYRGLGTAPSQPATANSPIDIKQVLKCANLYYLGLCFGLYSFQYSAILQFVPLWLVAERGSSLLFGSLLATVYCIANIAGNLLGGKLMARGWQATRLLIFCSLGMAALSLPIFRDEVPDILRLILFVLFPLIGGIIPACAFSLVPRLAPSPALTASCNGLVVQLLNMGMFFGAPVQATFVAHFGWSSAGGLLMPVALLCAYLAWKLRRKLH